MGWFPQFLNLGTAATAAAIAAPLLLMLYFLKLRRREQTVPSTLLWKKAIQDLQVNAPFQKLRRNLLLLLQMLLLALMVLALSRPITFFTPGAGKNTVIIIDRSASMNAKDVDGVSRLDIAKRRAKELVDTLDRGGKALVIAADDHSDTVQTWSSDTALIKHAIDGITGSDRRTSLKQAYQMADALTNFTPEQLRPSIDPPDVFVYSDGRVMDGNELAVKGTLRYEKIGNDATGNIAIVSLSAKRNYERPNEVQVFARLQNFGTEPVKTDVELWVAPLEDPKASDNFESRGVATASLLPTRWDRKAVEESEKSGNFNKDSVDFKLDLPTAAIVRVEQKNKQNDLLGADDAAWVVLPPPKPLSVLLVTNGNYYLEKAINGLGLKDPITMSTTEFEQKQPKDFDVVMFDRYIPNALPTAANIITFDAVPPGLKLKQTTDHNQPVILQDVGVLDWERDHPILQGLSLGKVYAAETLKLDLPLEAEVLIDGTKGPLAVLYREGKVTSLIVSFDVLQSNWPLRVSFPIFLHNALQYMALGSQMDSRESYSPGATPRIPRANLQRVDSTLKNVRVIGPAGSRDIAVPEAGDVALPPLDQVGVYRTEPPIPQFERFAVNLCDANESNLQPVDHPPGGVGTMVNASGGKTRLELWWWVVACGALPLLMIEWWVYTRRVHL